MTLTLLGRCLYHCKVVRSLQKWYKSQASEIWTDCWVISVLPDVAMGILCIGDIWSKGLKRTLKHMNSQTF